MGQRAANGVAVDAELFSQNVFRGQAFTGRVLALPNCICQLLRNARPKALALRLRGVRAIAVW
jgi:hypothetical protein